MRRVRKRKSLPRRNKRSFLKSTRDSITRLISSSRKSSKSFRSNLRTDKFNGKNKLTKKLMISRSKEETKPKKWWTVYSQGFLTTQQGTSLSITLFPEYRSKLAKTSILLSRIQFEQRHLLVQNIIILYLCL